ncbi:unnamed protein product, partial [Rotaria magnacalcarata]
MSMQIIWQATINECKSQEEVDILKQHLYIKRLPKSFDYLDESYSKIENKLARPIYNDNTRTTMSARHRKIIAQNKCDLMKLYINMAEAAVRGYRQYGEDEKQNLINLFTRLTSEQLALLARGPKYVPPCQIQFYRQETKEKIIE